MNEIFDFRKITEMTRSLESKNPERRWLAVRFFAENKEKCHVRKIAELLADEHSYVRKCVIFALRDFNAKQYEGEIIKCLKDPAHEVVETAKEVLREWESDAIEF